MRNKKRELLAPAGSPQAFYGAIHAGADGVYLAGSRFGARAYADNFTEEELVRCIRYAHLWGRRVYLTVNTLVKEQEALQLLDFLRPYYEAGLDGVIVQDLGALSLIRDAFPLLRLHASTQMNLTGAYGAAYVKSLGVCRVVLARELSLEEIRHVKESTGMEIEVFVHGAMCYSYSGQCLFSSLLGGRSGNRGRCAQPCRLPYCVASKGGKSPECYPLSLKDLCAIDRLAQLADAGVDSFKIEGRMKKPEYAAGVTAIYRRALDRYERDPDKGLHVAREDREALSRLYIRTGIQDGYLDKHNGADMVTLQSPGYNGSDDALTAQIRERYLDQKPLMEIDLYVQFRQGEPAKLTLVCGGHSASVEGAVVLPARGAPITRKDLASRLGRLGDTSFRIGEAWIDLEENVFYPLGALNDLRRRAVRALEDQIILGHGLCPGRAASRASVDMAEEAGLVHGTCPGRTTSRASTDAAAAASLVHGTCPGRASCRQEEASTGRRGNFADDSAIRQEGSPLFVSLSTLEQCKALAKSGILPRRVYVEGDLWVQKATADAVGELLWPLAARTSLFLSLPRVLRQKEEEYLRKVLEASQAEDIAGIQVRSLEGFAFLDAHGFQKQIAADASFHIWNSQTLRSWQGKLSSFCLPYELNAREQWDFLQAAHAVQGMDMPLVEKVVFGRIPMMVTANCVLQTTMGCGGRKGGQLAWLEDRKRMRFPVVADCGHCFNTIYNTVPLSLHQTLGKWTSVAAPRLDFTTEDGKECGAVLRFFAQAAAGGSLTLKPPYDEYTTGHERRGVE